MITIYDQNETQFNTNGLGVLEPISCVLSVALNGAWMVELEHPFDKYEKYKHIQKDGIIRIDNIPIVLEQESHSQLFRIYDTVNTLTSVKAVAFPVAFEATYDAIIEELKTEKQTATLTLVDIMAYLARHGVTKYTIESDYSQSGVSVRQKKGNFVNTNLIAAISGSDDGSIINHWGGEVAYDNYKLIVNGRLGKIGTQAGYYEVRYGKNLAGLSVDTDMSGVVTRLYPISADEVRLVYTPSGAQDSQSYVDSPLIVAPNTNPYPYIRSAFIETEYTLIDTSYDASKPNSNTAIATHGVQTAITNAIHTVMSDMWTDMLGGTAYPHTASGKWYEPEWIQDNIDDVVKTLQTELLTTWNITHPSFKNLVQTCIKDGISWIKKEDLGEDYWEQVNDAWQYVHAGRTIKNQYFYIDRRYCYFNVSGTYEPWKDVKSMDWIQGKTSRAKKKYGNNQRYYAQNETVYTMGDDGEGNRQFNEYYFDSDGWWDGVSNTESSWNWYQSGNRWWFGEEGATSEDKNKFAHDTWLFIKSSDDATTDGGKPTLYYFDSEGYMVDFLSVVNCGWDWREQENRDYFGSTDKTQRAVYITNQYLKVDGAWKKFGSDSYVVKNETLKSQLTTVLKNAINTALGGTGGTIETQSNILYNLLYEQMVSYCLDRFAEGVDKPAVNIQIDTLDLMKTKGYEDIVQITPTPAGYWDCDDEWKTTDYVIAWQAPTWHDRYWKYNYGLACGCIGRYYYEGDLVYGFVSLSGNIDDCAMSSNGRGGTKATVIEVEIEGQTFYRSTDLHTIYPLMVSEGSLKELDFYATHGRYASSFDEFFRYFLEVSHFTTQKKDLSGIHLGDDVNVIDYEHGYDIKERCVALKYDCIRGYNIEITIDKLAKNLSQILGTSNLGNSDGSNRLIAGEGVTITNGVIEVHTDSGNTYNGSQVSVDAIATGGQKIADIYIDGTPHPIYGDGGTQYTAGANVQISSGNVISATDTKYTAGTNVQISDQNVISATDTTYNDFAGSAHGLVPAAGSGDSGKYLKADGSWDTPSGAATYTAGDNIQISNENVISATDTKYTAGENVNISEQNVISATDTTYSDFDGGAHGLVPAPSSGDSGKYLKADGSWDTPTDTTYTAGANVDITNNVISATDTTYSDFSGSAHGLVPSVSTQAGKYLKDDGSWDTPTDTTYSDFSGSAHGLVPPVDQGESGFLKSDGTWATPTGGASALEDLTDVDITTPTEGQILKYDGSEWVNADSDAEIVTHLIKQGSSAWYKKHDDANTYVRLSSSSTIGEYWNFQSKSDFSSGDYHEEIVYKNAIPLSARRIRYKLEATNKNANISDNYIVIGLKTTLDSTNYAYTSDTDFVYKESIFYDQETTIEGEIEIQPTAPLYLYVTTTGWTVNIYTLDVVEYSSGAPTLEELEDVNISSPSDGQVLSWDSQNNEWKNTNQSGGTTVVANPSGTATADLSKIQIGSDIYDIPNGGGGGGRTVTTLYTNTGTSAPNSIILSDAYTNYDELYIFGYRTNNTSYKATSIYMTDDININDKITVGDDALYAWYTVTNATTLTNAGANIVIDVIRGIKY